MFETTGLKIFWVLVAFVVLGIATGFVDITLCDPTPGLAFDGRWPPC